MDQAFIRKLSNIVLANISDETFGAEKLAKEAGMSRVSLYRRIKFIKNQDVSQFIREIRLRRGQERIADFHPAGSEFFRCTSMVCTAFNDYRTN